MGRTAKSQISQAIQSWTTLQDYLKNEKYTENDLLELIKAEQSGANRIRIKVRIYQRYNMLRSQRERKAL